MSKPLAIKTVDNFKTWFHRVVTLGDYKVVLNTANAVILKKNSWEFCPVTAIRQELTGQYFSVCLWPDAASGIMPNKLARNIVRAADKTYKSDRSISAELRKFLLEYVDGQIGI